MAGPDPVLIPPTKPDPLAYLRSLGIGVTPNNTPEEAAVPPSALLNASPSPEPKTAVPPEIQAAIAPSDLPHTDLAAHAATIPPEIAGASSLGMAPAPPPKPKKSFGQKLRAALPYIGAAGGVMEAAGNRGQAPQADKLMQLEENAANRALKTREMEEIEKPKAQAYSDYYSGRNESSEDVARIRGQYGLAAAQARNQAGLMQAQVKALSSGLMPVFDQSGAQVGFRAATKEEFAQMPLLKAHADHLAAQADLAEAQAEYNRARPGLERDKIAAQMALLKRRLQDSEAGLALRQREFGINNYGIDPSTGQTPPGVALLDNGQGGQTPVGKKFQGNVLPTNAAKGRGEQAQAIQIVGRGLVDQIKENTDVLGPTMGRFNSLADWWGSPDPRFKGLKAALESWIALHPAAHGFRGLNAVKQFEKAFGTPMNSPEALIAGIEGSYGTMEGLQQVGSPRVAGGSNNRAASPAGGGGGNAAPEGTVISVGNTKQIKRNGKWVPYTGR